MSTQTVYFNNPASITNLQQSVGTTPGQITTSLINLTGALINVNNIQFVDKYTIDKGLGNYQVDCIPIVMKDTFACPKFSGNLSTTTGTHIGCTGGSNNISHTTGAYDTLVAPDIVVFAPSVRTTMETSPLFSSTGVGECMNAGAFGITLEDWKGNVGTYNLANFIGAFGSTGLGYKYDQFHNVICASGTTSTGTRQAALDAIRADPDFITIKNQMKYPFKKFNHIKVAGDFQYENLLDLNGNALVNTLADGVTTYNTQITSTSYSATGNLLPISQNINANQASGTMGLCICHMGNSRSPFFSNMYHQLAGLGYVTIFTTHNPIAQTFQKYSNSKSYSTLLAEKVISTSSTSSVAGTYINGGTLYGSTTDNLVSGGGENGFFRNNARNNAYTEQGAIIMERFFYQIKCILQKLGIGRYIDYNNVVIFGESAGGYAMNSADRFISTGMSTSYKLSGSLVPLFKTKAFIAHQCIFYEYSKKLDSNNAINQFNNKYALGLNVLNCPLIWLTGDGDVGQSTPTDNRYNGQAQIIYQTTKLSTASSADENLGLSTVFYKPSLYHGSSSSTPGVSGGGPAQNSGKFNSTLSDGFLSDWLSGWYLPLKPQFPLTDSIYLSGLQSELVYSQFNELKFNTIVQMMGHRFMGNSFPFPTSAMNALGIRYDLGPTAVDVATDFAYTRVGPVAKLDYDSNYNVTLSAYNYQTSTTASDISFIATNSTGAFRNLSATVDITAPKVTLTNLAVTSSALPATDVTIAYKIPVVVNGTTYYISLTAAQ